jgi:hypothetical protein
MKVRTLKLLIPEDFSIPTLNIVFCSPQSIVDLFDVTFDEPVDKTMLEEFRNCIRDSSTLNKLRITISTDLRRELCQMMKQTKLRECVVRFINDINFLRYCHMSPRQRRGVPHDEMQQGTYCLVRRVPELHPRQFNIKQAENQDLYRSEKRVVSNVETDQIERMCGEIY